MEFMQPLGKALMIFGIAITAAGACVYFGSRLGIGRLPGDIFFRRGGFSFYFPVVTCIIISIILTVIFNLFNMRR